ncbi:MAG: bifunctional nuclease family protein [Bacteroidales bacterium]|nr:bifunctional nuclease family protein [Bacteroidales bacterium]
MEKIQLEVYGVSHSQAHSGAYALILQEKDGQRRLPIIIGANEAQAIAIKLEKLAPQRPLTHDLFLNFASAFGIQLIEVNIIKLKLSVFYSELVCVKDSTVIRIDARTSDAIALAVRFNSPIYTVEKVMEEAGIDIGVLHKEAEEQKSDTGSSTYKQLSIDQLKEMLEKAVGEERYEDASLITEELKNRGYDT